MRECYGYEVHGTKQVIHRTQATHVWNGKILLILEATYAIPQYSSVFYVYEMLSE